MRAVRYHDHGGPEVLIVEEIPAPDPGHGEVLVDVRAAAVNPVDTYFREGSYAPPELPMIPGSDLAGVVAAVGPEVDDYEEGDRVFATALGNDHQGTCAEQAVVPTEFLAPLPGSVSFETGAASALVGATAFQALIARSGLEVGESCLVHGGNGGVGHLAVQLADAAGTSVTTTARPTYRDRLRELGADTVLDYGRDDLESAIEAAGAPDVLLDHRLDDYLSLDVRVAAHGGRIAAIGNSDPAATFENVPATRGKEVTVNHVSVFNTPDVSAVLERLARLMDDGDFGAVVAREYDLEGVAEAQESVLSESVFGKFVVVP